MVRLFTSGALRHRNFRLFFAGNLVSLVGWWMHQVAQPWLVLDLTNSPFYVGVVSAMGTLPVTLFSLFGGVVAERYPKRKVIAITQTSESVARIRSSNSMPRPSGGETSRITI